KILGIGGIAKKSNKERKNVIRIVNNKINKNKKFHLFGVTDFNIIKFYKEYIYSIDSTNFKLSAGYGRFHFFENGKLNNILISDRQKNKFNHFNHSKLSKKKIEKSLGINLEKLRKDYMYRRVANMIAQLRMINYINNNKFDISNKKRKSLI
ncbi:MAG: hypothetical protein ACOCRK_09520, partial [bacterium]